MTYLKKAPRQGVREKLNSIKNRDVEEAISGQNSIKIQVLAKNKDSIHENEYKASTVQIELTMDALFENK